MYIKNFGEEFDDDQLQKTFEKFGPIVSCVVMKDVMTNMSRGFGFVSFENHEDAAKVCTTPCPCPSLLFLPFPGCQRNE